mmetsp:Transcript_76045/g.178413  ORF Transcript_76045/g.178413 Transcript_76045/m.178413 type:complete len:200 (+) Transcript_76045:264-863(+)
MSRGLQRPCHLWAGAREGIKLEVAQLVTEGEQRPVGRSSHRLDFRGLVALAPHAAHAPAERRGPRLPLAVSQLRVRVQRLLERRHLPVEELVVAAGGHEIVRFLRPIHRPDKAHVPQTPPHVSVVGAAVVDVDAVIVGAGRQEAVVRGVSDNKDVIETRPRAEHLATLVLELCDLTLVCVEHQDLTVFEPDRKMPIAGR